MNLLDEIRLQDPEFFLPRPHELMAELRRIAPVHHDPHTDAWVVSRYIDNAYALRNPDLFASGLGVRPSERTDLTDSVDTALHGGDYMLMTDPPRHTALRRAIQPGFTAPRVAIWQARLRSVVTAVLDEVPMRDSVDAYTSISKTLALGTICEYLGIPHADAPWLDSVSSEWTPQGDDFGPDTLEQYFAALIIERAQSPRDDVVSLIAAMPDSEMTLYAKLMFCIDLFIAGNEPTAAAITGGFQSLAEHPDQYEALRSAPERSPTALQEMLRWASPVPYMCRTATADVELGGTLLPRGAFIYLLFVSANRDGEFWDQPDRFDITRADASKHLSFGRGVHTCVGAPLVRTMLQILLEETVARFGTIEIAGPVGYQPDEHMPRIHELPLAFSPAR